MRSSYFSTGREGKMSVTVIFFEGSGTDYLVGLPIRLLTREKGQSLYTVPSHTGIYFNEHNEYFEAVLSGVHSDSMNYDQVISMPGILSMKPLTLPKEDDAFKFAQEQVGKPYDKTSIFLDAVGLFLSQEKIELLDNHTDALNCSRYVSSICSTGGFYIPTFQCPINPNQIKLYLDRH